MATEKKYYIGVGNAAVATLDANRVAGPFDDLKENVMVEITLAAEYADNFSTARDSANRQDLHAKIKDGPVEVTVTVKENAKRVMEIALHGKSSVKQAGTVTGEKMPSGIVTGQQYFTEHPNASNIAIEDSAGDPSDLVEGQHYKVNESGAITFLDIDAADPVAATGNIHFAAQPNNNDTTTVGGKTYTWKTAGPVGDQILIGDDIETSATNLAQKINTDTATTLCTADPAPADVALTANTRGVAGNTITLTVDGARLTKTAFASGDDADAFVQPFFVSYTYGEVTEVGILDDSPANVAFRFDGKNLTRSPDRFLRAFLKEVSFGPSAKFTLKSGSATGTGNSVNEYELKGVALDVDGSGYGKIEVW